jgi:hypothetical protein
MFLHLKKFFGGCRFLEDDDVKEAVNTRFSSYSTMRGYKNWCPS